MSQTATSSFDRRAAADLWLKHVARLAEQIAEWSAAQGWVVTRSTKSLEDRTVGTQAVPLLVIQIGENELRFEPIGRQAFGADGRGRVDLEAFPSLNRVKVLGGDGEHWLVMTDSNVPLRQPWNEQTFVQLALDLVG